MKCVMCGHPELSAPVQTTVPYASLPGTMLSGVDVRTCPSCGEEFVSIPRMDELAQVLAHEVAHKPGRLTGPEVRYLRRTLGWSGTRFAEHFATDKTTVSKWESGARRMDERAELLLRVLVTRSEPMAPEEVEEQLASVQQPDPAPERQLRLTGETWAPGL